MAFENCNSVESACSPERIRKFLSYYDKYRNKHPIPGGWTQDATQLMRVAQGDYEADPIMLFNNADGARLDVSIEFESPVNVVVTFDDRTGKALTLAEMLAITELLLGIRIGVDDLEQIEQSEADLCGRATEEGTWTRFLRFDWEILNRSLSSEGVAV